MFNSRMIALLATVAFLPASVAADPVPAGLKAGADAVIARAYDSKGPGVVVLVTQDGTPIYQGVRGLSDVERGLAMSADTLFRYASITKQFTAALVMKLVEEGRLSLDDRLSEFLPDYPAPGRDVTVRQLLTHSSGIANYTGLETFRTMAVDKPQSTAAVIELFRDQPLDFAPGSDMRYSNSGYVLLQAIVERLTGQSLAEALQTTLLAPAGLEAVKVGDQAGQARGYGRGPIGPMPAPAFDPSVAGGAGALTGDASSLARWMDELHGGRIVSPTSLSIMTTPLTLSDGSRRDYGFGLGLGKLQGQSIVGHSGGIFGFATDALYLPEQKMAVVVLANSDSPAEPPEVTALRVMALAIGRPLPSFEPVAMDLAEAAAFSGIYGEGANEQQIFVEKGKLLTVSKGAPRTELIALKDGLYSFGPDKLRWARFSGDGDKRTLTLLDASGSTGLRLDYRGPVPERETVVLSADRIAKLSGRYKGPMGVVSISGDRDGGLLFQIEGEGALVLRPEANGHFAIDEFGADIEANDDRLIINFNGQRVEALRE